MWGLRTAILLVLLAGPLSGCLAAEGGATKSSPTIAPAAAPTAAADTGSIAGKTLDEEQLPIDGVGVVLAENRNSTKSDENGAFTFNDLQPGTYTLLTGRAGFKEQAKKVDVRAGEITEVTIFLKPIALPAEWVQIDRQTQAMNAATTAVVPNDVQSWPKAWVAKDDPKALEGMKIEADWTPTTPLADGIRIWSGIPLHNSEKTLCVSHGYRPYSCVVPPEKFKVDWGCDYATEPNSCRAQWLIRPGVSRITQGQAGAWAQDVATIYVSHFYRLPMPPEYSALKP